MLKSPFTSALVLAGQKDNLLDGQKLSVRHLRSVFEGFHLSNVGFGRDPHSIMKDEHWPTAYGLVASAALRVEFIPGTALTRDIGEQAIAWLLQNVGCASSGLPVWGLPYGRKIWLDAFPCQPGTGFNVPTVHAIQALCEYARAGSPHSQACKQAAYMAAKAFADRCSSKVDGRRVFWYSTLEAHSFHVLNAISLMAGEVQRVAQLCEDAKLASMADEAISYVLASMEMEGEAPIWNYFGSRMPDNTAQKRNDILHEAFVCQGLLTYKLCGGILGDRIVPEKLLKALAKFHRDGQIWDFPESEANSRRRSQPARAIGLAQSLYVLVELYAKMSVDGAAREAHAIFKTLDENILSGSLISYRSGGSDISSYTRTRAHILLGLSQYCNYI